MMKPNMIQIIAAAVVSPLAVFVIVPVSLVTGLTDAARFSFPGNVSYSVALAMTLLPWAWLMMLLVGVPAALLARRCNFTSVWFAAATGFICPWIGLPILFASIESRSIPFHLATVARWGRDLYLTLIFERPLLISLSGLGFVIGTVFWFVASLRLTRSEEV